MKLDDVASPAYRKLLRETHKLHEMKWGGGGKYWPDTVIAFAKELGGVQTILDYGCGQGVLKRRLDEEPQLEVREYDPGIVGKDEMPEPADMVVCTDVLEHVETKLVPNVLAHLRQLTVKGAFLLIALGNTKTKLADGEPAHLTIKPYEWWIAGLNHAGFTVIRHELGSALKVWVR